MRKIRTLADGVEYGFGRQINQGRNRVMNRDGSSNIVRIGDKPSIINIYHSLITMSWFKFMTITLLYYVVLNSFFTAMYYWLDSNGISGMQYTTNSEKLSEIFYFSAQSLTTVGYGRLNPVGHAASLIAAVESLSGLMGFALVTGLLYGRFSRPTAKLIFSNDGIIGPYKHERFPNASSALMMRIANARRNQLLEVEAQILFSYNDDSEGKINRRFQTLNLEVSKISYLTMSWTVVHPIDESSPLYGLSDTDLNSVDAEFLLNIKAMDETYAQQVYTRSSYKSDEIKWNSKFVSVIATANDGRTAVDLRKIHDTLPA